MFGRMNEEQFRTEFIAATQRQDQRKMRSLCRRALNTFGETTATQLAEECYQIINSEDPELAGWLNMWFRMMG